MKKEITTEIETSATNGGSSLRPTGFSTYIGQTGIVDNLKVYIQACKTRSEALDHILLYGPAGLGKTSLAYVIAEELGASIKTASGPSIEKAGELASILSTLNDGDILFIDEIHRLPKVVEEILYSAMEDFCIDVVVGKDSQSRSIRLDLPRFTLIGATTRAGMLSAPLRDRFGIVERLQYYTPKELRAIVTRSAEILNIKITSKAGLLIGNCSRGTPRIANNLVKRCRDFASVKGDIITEEVVKDAFDKLGIGEMGLNDTDRLIIDTIKDKCGNKPVGLSTIASMIGEDEDTIESVYEPYLIFLGILIKTPRGRIIAE